MHSLSHKYLNLYVHLPLQYKHKNKSILIPLFHVHAGLANLLGCFIIKVKISPFLIQLSTLT